MMKVSGAAIIAVNPVCIKTVLAAEAIVNESDLQAKEIHYVLDSTRVTKEQFDFYVSGSNCTSCSWFRQQGDSKLGHCLMYFPDALVSSNGWCIAWNSKN